MFSLSIVRSIRMASVLVTRRMPEPAIALLKQAGLDVDMWHQDSVAMPRDVLMERIKGKKGVLCVLADKMNEVWYR